MGKTLALIFVPALLVAAILQMIFGNPDIGVFAFPVNAAILLVMAGGLLVLNREKNESRFVNALSSSRAAIIAIAASGLCCLVMAFFPGLEFQKSWIFGVLLLILMANLYLAVLRYRGKSRTRFYLNHAGLFIMLFSLSFGSADMKRTRAAVDIGDSISMAYAENGTAYPLGYVLRVDSFDADFYDNNTPSEFRAVVSDGNVTRTLKVNHPWRRSWKEDIYLTGYDTEAGDASGYCILEFVVQPWKYAALTGILLFVAGAMMLLWGGRRRI